MGRILRIELRRSAAAGIALWSLVVGTGLLMSFPQGFAGRWMQLAVAVRLMLLVLWPFTLAGGAWMGRRDARNRVNELFASTARPRWQRVLPTAGALALTVVTAYTLMFGIGAAWVVPTSGYFPTTAIAVVAVGALSLIAAGWLGLAAGRALPQLATAPALAVLAAALLGLLPAYISNSAPAAGLAAPAEPAAMLLTPVFGRSVDDFQTIVARVNLTQTLWLAALAASGILLLGAVGRRALVLGIVPAVLGAAIVVPLMPAGGYEAAATLDPGAVELVCDDNGPPVCVTRAHAGLLPDVVGPARAALAVMAAKLPGAPTRAVENQQPAYWAQTDRTPNRHPADTLVFDSPSIGATGRADLTDGYFSPDLIDAVWRQDCGDQAFNRDEDTARRVATAWLTGQPPTPPNWWQAADRARADSAYRTLIGMPPDEQRRRIAAARDAALDCDATVLVALLPPDAP